MSNFKSTFNFFHFDKIDSTNKYAIQNINSFESKTIISADKQTNGKGRNNRNWVSSEPNNLYFTIILKSSNDNFINILPNISQLMAILLCRVFENYEVKAEIKWPNDILVGGKKIAGILCETSIKNNEIQGLALGVGVNLNLSENFLNKIDQPATSLNMLIKNSVDKKNFLEQLLNEFSFSYSGFSQSGFHLIRDEYKEKSCFLDKKIKVVIFDEIYEGLAKDVDENGQLLLMLDNGMQKNINLGDIFL